MKILLNSGVILGLILDISKFLAILTPFFGYSSSSRDSASDGTTRFSVGPSVFAPISGQTHRQTYSLIYKIIGLHIRVQIKYLF